MLGTLILSGSGPMFAIAWGGATDEVNNAN